MAVERHDAVVGRVLGREHATAPERVVRDDQPARAQPGQGLLVVVDVALLVGVEEDQVEGRVVGQRAQRLQRVAEHHADLPPVGAPVEERSRHAGGLGVAVAGEELAVVGQALGHAERGVAGEGPDLEDAARPEECDQQLEQGALHAADLHLRIGDIGVGAFAELIEEGRARSGVVVDVLLEGLGAEEGVHGAVFVP